MTAVGDRLLSPIPYYGSKARLAERIATMLPPHSHYVEACAGSLSVLLAKAPARMETVNDLDQHLMTFWRVLRDRPTELERACALTPHARSEHRGARDLAADVDEIELARRVWVMLTQGRTGVLRSTGWRHARSADDGFCGPGRLSSYTERLAAVAQRLRNVSLECRPAAEVLRAYGQGPRTRRTLIYVDPPYLGGTRTRNYRVEATSAAAHIELAEAARAASATVVVSGYACELYDRELYPDWYRYELAAWTTQGGTHRPRTEVLWSNRPLRGAEEGPEFRNSAPALATGCNETRCGAPGCGKVLTRASTGRPARFCSDACRVRAHRAARSAR
ncbi:DNA adenine methylase [Nocardia wallacei]|uniref:DNA adenine methylase n=1 Tax=Nocardia wallacei TaxID=480035 RepID=UPI0024540504|nr:DNA adenine methylase [Nocardia wallacei]